MTEPDRSGGREGVSPVLRLGAAAVGEVVEHRALPGQGGDRRPLAQGLVRTLPVVPEQPLPQLPVQQGQVRLVAPEQVLVVVEELP